MRDDRRDLGMRLGRRYVVSATASKSRAVEQAFVEPDEGRSASSISLFQLEAALFSVSRRACAGLRRQVALGGTKPRIIWPAAAAFSYRLLGQKARLGRGRKRILATMSFRSLAALGRLIANAVIRPRAVFSLHAAMPENRTPRKSISIRLASSMSALKEICM